MFALSRFIVHFTVGLWISLVVLLVSCGLVYSTKDLAMSLEIAPFALLSSFPVRVDGSSWVGRVNLSLSNLLCCVCLRVGLLSSPGTPVVQR